MESLILDRQTRVVLQMRVNNELNDHDCRCNSATGVKLFFSEIDFSFFDAYEE
jgi:hypothetical protein